jgi:hypothetical protein
MRKAGMRYEGTLRGRLFNKGRYVMWRSTQCCGGPHAGMKSRQPRAAFVRPT